MKNLFIAFAAIPLLFACNPENNPSEEKNNPKELIVANASDRMVEIQIHEPLSGYDPKSEESGWQAGPFMYWADLKPGELARFVVDMPDLKADATMCMYMLFEGDESKYYIRIFKFDQDDPYLSFTTE